MARWVDERTEDGGEDGGGRGGEGSPSPAGWRLRLGLCSVCKEAALSNLVSVPTEVDRWKAGGGEAWSEPMMLAMRSKSEVSVEASRWTLGDDLGGLRKGDVAVDVGCGGEAEEAGKDCRDDDGPPAGAPIRPRVGEVL